MITDRPEWSAGAHLMTHEESERQRAFMEALAPTEEQRQLGEAMAAAMERAITPAMRARSQLMQQHFEAQDRALRLMGIDPTSVDFGARCLAARGVR